ncbi:dynamin central region domain-containing protein [Ditylenchus destructor]|nr:dynamin central region domain-containing protein [Ditylenchus destructor]
MMIQDNVIATVDKMRDVIKTAGMDPDKLFKFPQITVLGDQSVGKSSLVENIVGHRFLPRGKGMITKRPLVLRLVRAPLNDPRRPNEIGEKDWAVFGHKPKQTFTDFRAVHDEIEREFQKVDGSDISNEEIILTIYSHSVVDISLVDLPGLIRLTMDGQDKTLDSRIEKLVHKYIKEKNTLILAVSEASNDIQNSGALSLAKEVDPNGDRTLALFTKMDRIETDDSAKELLLGTRVKAKLGIIGVINHVVGENDNQSIGNCLEYEKEYFAKRFPQLANSGIPFLKKSLNRVLIQHIMRCLPEVENSVQTHIASNKNQLQQYKDMDFDKPSKLIQIIRVCETYLHGDITGGHRGVQIDYPSTGARIHEILYEKLPEILTAIDPTDGLTPEKIATAKRNTQGYLSEPGFGINSFRVVLRDCLCLLEEPCLEIVNDVHMEMRKAASECQYLADQKSRFPALVDGIISASLDHLRSKVIPTKKLVVDLVEVEKPCINFRNADFLRSNNQIAKIMNELEKIEVQEKEEKLLHAPKFCKNSTNNIPSDLLEESLNELREAEIEKNEKEASKSCRAQNDVASNSATENDPNFHSVPSEESPESSLNQSSDEESIDNADISPGNSASLCNGENSLEYGKFCCFRDIVDIYFNDVRKKLIDIVPKIIGKFLIEDFLCPLDGICHHLFMNLTDSEVLLAENEDIKSAREKLEHELLSLEKAQASINELKNSKSHK